MKTNEFITSDLSNEELNNTNGGIIMALAAIGIGFLGVGIILLPLAASAYRGWQDVK